nr:acyltransferase [uncultured Roseateles sp.]
MSKSAHRFHEIDLLRGIACASVLLFHFLSRAPQAGWMSHVDYPQLESVMRYGYLGVHLFFVISGFVILMSAQGATPRQFFASRVARLFPAFWVAVCLTAGTAWWLGESRFAVSLPHFLVNLSMLPHWFNIPFVDGAYWSLAVELHFYAYIWIVLRLQQMRRIEWLMLAWLLVALVDLIRPAWPLELWLDAKWAPLFVAGGVFYLIRTQGLTPRRVLLLLASYGLALASALRESGGEASLANPWIVTAIITVIYLIFTAIAFDRWRLPASRLTFWAGALTYPVYVIHQFFGIMLYQQLRAHIDNTPLVLAMVIALVLALAAAIHVWVEKPFGPRLRRWVEGKSAATAASVKASRA